MDNNKVSITVELSNEEAEAFSDFLKRASFMSYREHSIGNEKASLMQNAGSEIKKALAKK